MCISRARIVLGSHLRAGWPPVPKIVKSDPGGLPLAGGVAGQGEQLGPGEQVVGQGRDLAPDAVGGQALQGEGAQAGVLGAADAVLAPGPQPVADFQVGELPGARVGGEGGEPVSVDVVEAQPGAGVGFFAAHDDPHALGPSRQVQHAGDLRHVRALAGVAVGVVRGRPGGLGDLRVDVGRAVGELETHAVGHPAAGEEPHGLPGAPGPVDAHQHFPAGSGSQSGLVQGPRDHLDVVGGGVRPRVSRPQHDRRALPGPVGAVVEPGGQGVVAEPALERGGRPLLGRVRLHQGRVHVDHQRTLRADTRGRRVLPGQGPHPPPHLPPGRLHGRLDRVGVLGQGWSERSPLDLGRVSSRDR